MSPAPEPIDYADAVRAFRLDDLTGSFHGSLEHGLNVCVECCDRHVASGGIALDWENQAGERASFTFADMRERAARFAGVLVSRGLGPGDIVAGLLPRIPDLLTVILGTWRAGAVYQPLFTAFGPKAIEHRIKTSGAKLVVTDRGNRPKLDEVAGCPPVMVVGSEFTAALARQMSDFAPVLRRGDDLFLMMFTSGTTGPAKGVPVPLRALPSFLAYNRDAVGVRPDDRFWNIADPGWAYGLYYAITGPLLLGASTLFYDGPFTVESTCEIIRKHAITNLAGAPTAYRMMMAAGPRVCESLRGKLRAVSSAGEPLNPEVIRWFDEHLAVPIRDHYGQTECGMLVNNHHALRHEVHPGSAGLPMPGFRIAVLDADGREAEPDTPGVLAVDIARSPLHWFTGYWHQPAITGDYYITGDTVERKPDGRFTFVGRSDDVITSAGYRIGPFDVESALIEHPAVVEAGVVGKSDPERTEIVKAFVVLAPDYEAGPDLVEDLRQHVRRRLSAHAYPREIEFVDDLPKTPSGKIQRFVLRSREIEKSGGAS